MLCTYKDPIDCVIIDTIYHHLFTNIFPLLSTLKIITTIGDQQTKFHIVVFLWLSLGHITPFFNLSKLLAQKRNKVSFIFTPRNSKSLLKLPHVNNLSNYAEATMDISLHTVPCHKKAYDNL